MTLDDIVVVAPYNAQVACLVEALPAGARVGTVDRFQGQEAAVSIFSMATSSVEDLPRNLEFLFSLNRLNVAVSRARGLSILVCSLPPGARVGTVDRFQGQEAAVSIFSMATSSVEDLPRNLEFLSASTASTWRCRVRAVFRCSSARRNLLRHAVTRRSRCGSSTRSAAIVEMAEPWVAAPLGQVMLPA